MIDYRIIPVTPFQQNCCVIWCEKTRKAAITDPGGDLERVLAVVAQQKVQVEKVLLTHGHIDHAAAAAQLARQLGVPIEGPQEADRFWIEGLPQQCEMFGLPGAEAFEPDRWLCDNDTVIVGEAVFRVIHTPGHTPGHVTYFQAEKRLAIVGDVLFAGSIGRTDFPQGSHEMLIRSIREKLFPLGSDVVFIPGHGPVSTFGQERNSNPYVADHAVSITKG